MRDQTYWAYNYCPTSFSWLVLLGLVFYLAAFAPGERLNLSFSPHTRMLLGKIKQTITKKEPKIEHIFFNSENAVWDKAHYVLIACQS